MQQFFTFPRTALLALLLLSLPLATRAQQGVGIGTSTPDAKAALDISATDKGLLIPRLTESQRLALGSNLPDGLMVFQTDNATGFWYYLNGAWINIPSAGDNLGNHSATQNLALNNNTLLLRPANDFYHGLRFNLLTDGPQLYGNRGGQLGYWDGTGVTSVLHWTNSGQVGIRTTTPAYPLDVAGDVNTRTLLRVGGQVMAYRSSNNTFLGVQTIPTVAPTGDNNTLVGPNGGRALTTGGNNTTLGFSAGDALTSGSNNAFVGIQAGGSTTTGTDNVFIGHDTGINNVGGSRNVAVGGYAGNNVTLGNDNTFLGHQTNLSGTTQRDRATAVGYNAKVDQNDAVVLGDPANAAVRVGIGTTQPSQKLDVNGTARLRGLAAGVVTADADGNLSSSAATTVFGNSFVLNSTARQAGASFNVGGTGTVGGLFSAEAGAAVTGTLRVDAASANDGSFSSGAPLRGLQFGQVTSGEGIGSARTGTVNNGGLDLYTAYIRRLSIDNAGRVGIGTSAPTQALDVVGSATVNGRVGIGTSAPTQALDVRGNVRLGDDNGSVVGTGQALELVGPGFNTDPVGFYRRNLATDQSELRVVVGDADDANDKFVVGRAALATGVGSLATAAFTPLLSVTSAGNVGIGASAPQAGLHVLAPELGGGATTARGVLASGGIPGGTPSNASLELRGGKPYVDFAEADVDFTTRLISDNSILYVNGGGNAGVLMNVQGGLRATNYANTSDARLKQHVRPLTGALAGVRALRGVRYEWNAEGVRRGGQAGAGQVGLLAQELERVYPELVVTGPDGYKAVNYAQLAPVLIEALKELAAENAQLRQQAAAAAQQAATAEATTASFEQRLRALEAAGATSHR